LVDELGPQSDHSIRRVHERAGVLKRQDFPAKGAVAGTALRVRGHREGKRPVKGPARDLDLHSSSWRGEEHPKWTGRMLDPDVQRRPGPGAKSRKKRPAWQMLLIYGALVVAVLIALQSISRPSHSISYSRFRDLVGQGRVTDVKL